MEAALAKDERGELAVRYDPKLKILFLVGKGTWTVPMLKAHQSEIGIAMKRARLDRECLLIYSDISEADVQPQDVADEIRAYSPRFARTSDRIATVVSSSLTKMQMRRLCNHKCWEFFMSGSAAMQWLLAHEGAPPPDALSANRLKGLAA